MNTIYLLWIDWQDEYWERRFKGAFSTREKAAEYANHQWPELDGRGEGTCSITNKWDGKHEFHIEIEEYELDSQVLDD